MTDLQTRIAALREAAKNTASWCLSSCYGRCPLCPDEFKRDALRVIEAQAAEIERLQERDAKLLSKQGTFKGTGDPALDACLLAEDPAFIAFRDSLPATYWARYDLSAVRLGWHYGQARKDAEIERLRTALQDSMRIPDSDIGWDDDRTDIIGQNGNDGLHYSESEAGPTPLRGRVTRRNEG